MCWKRMMTVGVLTLTPWLSQAADDPFPIEEKNNVLKYAKDILPVTKVAISGLNVKLGVHLERLTLLSGEGHTDSKVTSGLLAGAFTLMGAGSGVDFASREPVEDHLSADMAKAIAADIATAVVGAVQQNKLELVPPDTVTSAPFYGKVKGEVALTTDTENVKGGLFKPDYYFGYQQVPVLGYKYRSPGMFDISDSEVSPKVRELAGVPVTLAWSVKVVNDRKTMRVIELSLKCLGKGQGFGNGDQPLLWLSMKPDALSVPSGESHKNLEYWSALSPKFAMAVNSMMQKAVAELSKTAN
ncbi:hypothetical protein [Leeia oryzae]|uniref:hypothetical protein n=1 Tax=Leeia oryzae TaxID=356662 RepID=UPI0003A19CD8|nr:hypothetical protein [Leeia oryzae]